MKALTMRCFLGSVMAVALAGAPAPAQAVPPANDSIVNAVALALGQTVRLNTREATSVPRDGECVDTASVWFTYTPTSDGRVGVSSVGSRVDTSLAVFSGPRAARTLVACDRSGWESALELSVTAGTKYWIALSGRNRGGNSTVSVYAPAARTMTHDLTVQATDVSGQLWVDVSSTCGIPTSPHYVVIARQRIGDRVARGYAEGFVNFCWSTLAKRHFELDGEGGLPFVAGPVSIEIQAHLHDGYGAHWDIQRTIETATLLLNARRTP